MGLQLNQSQVLSVGDLRAGEPRVEAGQGSEENSRRETMYSPQKLTMSNKGRGEPKLFKSCLPGIPIGLDTMAG